MLHREVRAWQAECARSIDPRTSADKLLGALLEVAMRYVEQHPLLLNLLLGETLRTLPDWSERLEGLREIGHTNVVEIMHLGAWAFSVRTSRSTRWRACCRTSSSPPTAARVHGESQT